MSRSVAGRSQTRPSLNDGSGVPWLAVGIRAACSAWLVEWTGQAYFPLPALSFVLVCFGFLGVFAFLSIVILQGCLLVAPILARPRRSVQPRRALGGDSSIRAPGANPRLTDDRPGSAPEGT